MWQETEGSLLPTRCRGPQSHRPRGTESCHHDRVNELRQGPSPAEPSGQSAALAKAHITDPETQGPVKSHPDT